MMKNRTLLGLAFVYIVGLSAMAQTTVLPNDPVTKKKLIFFGWSSPSTIAYRDSLKKYEDTAFDGLGINASKDVGAGNIFMVDVCKNISKEAREKEMQIVSGIAQSSILTDNFLVIYGASQLNWFSDEDWAIVDINLRYFAKLAKAMKCKGVMWDPEPYKPGINPWEYIKQQGHEQYSFQQFYNQVRKRGAQFIAALQEEFPGLVIFSLREFSDFQKGSPFSAGILPVTDIKKAESELANAWWGLHVPFTIGILDNIAPNVRFIDTNEEAYYYTSALEFFQLRNIIEDDARAFVPKDLQPKFASNYEIGHAIAPEFIAGNWAGILNGFPFRLSGQAKMLTPQEQASWFEHNCYYALRTADEYAWVYGEKISWWTGNNMPEGFAKALIQAKKKVENYEPLGFEVEEMLKIAQDDAEKSQPEKK
ncbi:MAG: hypothetical protein ABIR06_06555 [Cyclobacteriaceae bacterium]